MSKNLTRKGLAFGALVALSSSVIAGAPALAAGNGIADYVTLAANGGTYTNVLTTDTLDLKANFSPAVNEVSGRNLKFLVTDPNSTSRFDVSRTASNAATPTVTKVVEDDDAAGDTIAIVGTSLVNTAKYLAYGAAGTDAAFANDDVFTATSTTAASYATTGLSGDADATLDTQPTLENVVGLSSRAALLATSFAGNALESGVGYGAASTIGGTATTSGRTSTGSYVVTTNIYQAGSDVVLRLASNSADAQTYVVTSWIDIDGDNVIDGNEYASPDVTVKFLKPSDVTPTLTVDPVGINDVTLKARATFSPELNMTQTGNVKVSFTRQGFAEALVATSGAAGARNIAAASQVGTTSTWSSTIGLYNGSTDDTWDTAAVAAAVTDGTTAKVGNVVTITKASHLAVVGDIIQITSADAPFNNGYYVVASAASGSFTFDAGATASAETDWDYQIVGKAAVAGTYSAQVSLAGVLVGSAVYQSTGTTAVSALANEITAAAGVNVSTGAVRVGTTSDIAITSTATKSDTTAAASVPVLVTATAVTTAGTILVNGVKAAADGTWNLTTDASGKIALKVSNSSAKADETITLQVKTQGQTATTTLTWTAAAYTLYDLNSLDGFQTSRTVETGGSYTFKLALLDQWKNVPTSGSYRALVTLTGQTSSTQYVDLTSGKASLTVTDNKVGTAGYVDVQIDLDYKSTTATDYTTYSSGSKDWDGAWSKGVNSDDDIVRVHVIKDQTDVIALGLTGTTTYAYNGDSNTSDFSVEIAEKATVAQNRNETTVAQPAYGSTAAIVNGVVKNSITGIARAGALVTISGSSNILFSVGGVDSFGTITTVADDDGFFSVKAYSNKVQKDSVITFTTPDGASTTQKISFEPVEANDGASATITAKSIVPSGRTLPISVKLVDKYGNAVDTDATETNGSLKVTVSGDLGWSTTIAAQTDEDGLISFQQILAPEDHGVLTVTAKYDSNGSTADVAGTTVAFTTTKVVLVGVKASVSAGSKKANVVVKNASGATVKVVSGSKVVTKVATSDNYKLSLSKLTSGSKTVKVYVNDILVASKKVTVRR